MSGPTTTTFDQLANLQLILLHSLQLIFCQYCRLLIFFANHVNLFLSNFSFIFFLINCILFFATQFWSILQTYSSDIVLANHADFFLSILQTYILQFFKLFGLTNSSLGNPCKSRLNQQNLEANLQILLILFKSKQQRIIFWPVHINMCLLQRYADSFICITENSENSGNYAFVYVLKKGLMQRMEFTCSSSYLILSLKRLRGGV